MMDEDASNIPLDMIEGSENTPPFCSPSLLSFNDHQRSDLSPENMSFTSSCEFSLQLDPNILDDLQSDSDATCMPNESQSSMFENEIEAPATYSEKQKHYSNEISQDLFTNFKNSNEITQKIDVCTEKTAEEEENIDNTSTCSTISSFTSENVMTPSAQDLHLNKIGQKLAWINRKLKSSPTISSLRELKTCVGKLFGKLMQINDSQNVEKQQLSQSQGLGSRLAKRSSQLKKFIDISDELDAAISNCMHRIKPETETETETETIEHDENVAGNVTPRVSASCSQVGYPGDSSPALSLRENGTLYNKTGEEFCKISHWLRDQKGSQTVGEIVCGKSEPSTQRVNSIFDLLNFDKTLSLSTQLKQTKVLLTTTDDVLPQSFRLPQNFWSSDFSKILLDPTLIETIDSW